MTEASGGAVELRPGVFRPDWSAAKSAAARRALGGRAGAREGLLDKWAHALDTRDRPSVALDAATLRHCWAAPLTGRDRRSS